MICSGLLHMGLDVRSPSWPSSALSTSTVASGQQKSHRVTDGIPADATCDFGAPLPTSRRSPHKQACSLGSEPPSSPLWSAWCSGVSCGAGAGGSVAPSTPLSLSWLLSICLPPFGSLLPLDFFLFLYTCGMPSLNCGQKQSGPHSESFHTVFLTSKVFGKRFPRCTTTPRLPHAALTSL